MSWLWWTSWTEWAPKVDQPAVERYPLFVENFTKIFPVVDKIFCLKSCLDSIIFIHSKVYSSSQKPQFLKTLWGLISLKMKYEMAPILVALFKLLFSFHCKKGIKVGMASGMVTLTELTWLSMPCFFFRWMAEFVVFTEYFKSHWHILHTAWALSVESPFCRNPKFFQTFDLNPTGEQVSLLVFSASAAAMLFERAPNAH